MSINKLIMGPIKSFQNERKQNKQASRPRSVEMNHLE